MFSSKYLTKSVIYMPLLMSQRLKVRILPKIYDDYETPYMKARKPGRIFLTDLLAFVHRKNLTWAHYLSWRKWKIRENMQEDQRYNPDRHRTLGPDLAAVHYLTARNGKIKFTGNDKWFIYKDIENKEIPSFYVPGFLVEEIDISGMEILYEGFENLGNLSRLKKLHLNNCPFVDDWCLGRFHLFQNTLEYLDLSGCHLVTERGICTLHVLKKLKTLIINDTPNIQNRELVSLLLQDVIPECKIIGINYKDPVLLKRVENFLK